MAMLSPVRGGSGCGAQPAISSRRFRSRRSCRSDRWQEHRRWSRTVPSRRRRRSASTGKSRWLCGRTVRAWSSALASRVCSFEHITLPTVVLRLVCQGSTRLAKAGRMRVGIGVAVRGILRFSGAVRRVGLGFRRRRTDTVLRPELAERRKHRGHMLSIRRAHPCASLSSE